MGLDRYRLKPSRFSSHGRILAFLKQFQPDTRILDVGAATGYLGAALRARGFRRVSGIEANDAWSAEAAPHYERLAVCNIEQDALPWSGASFDAVICADILEHLSEPETALRALARLVVPGGWILVSLPNVAHWSVRLSLLAGRFDYTSAGILDRTHLRFYTRAAARRLLHDAGLCIAREAATPLPIAHWFDRAGRLKPVLQLVELLDVGCVRIRPTFFAYQFLFFCQVPG